MPGGIRQVTVQPEPADRRAANVEDAADRQRDDLFVAESLAALRIEHAQRVRGVVDDLPRAGDDRDQGIFQPEWEPHPPEKFEVAFGHIRVGVLASVIVVEDVVLVIPGLGVEPVEPVDEPPPAAGKDPAGVSRGNPRHPVVAAMNDVVGEEPPGELTETQQKRRGWIGDHPGRGVAPERGKPAVPLDSPEVGEVGLTDLLVGVGLQPLDVGAESGDVHLAQFTRRHRLAAAVHEE